MKKLDEIIGATVENIAEASAVYMAPEKDSESLKIKGVSVVFDRGILVIENPYSIFNSKNEKMKINALIGDSVRTADLSESEIRILFETDALLTISMRDEDFVGPEAASWNPIDGPIIVFN
jgi:hypothetical protein